MDWVSPYLVTGLMSFFYSSFVMFSDLFCTLDHHSAVIEKIYRKGSFIHSHNFAPKRNVVLMGKQ